MKIKNNYILCILGGAFLGISYPPFPTFLFAFIAFVLILYTLEDAITQKVKAKKFFLYFYIIFFVFHSITNWWVGSWQPNADQYLMVAGVALSLIHPLFFLVPIYFYFLLRKKLNRNEALWIFPFIWVAFEWLLTFGDLAYPWLTIGLSQTYNHLFVQIADIAGVWGVSFIIVLINVIILQLIYIIQEKNNKKNNFSYYFKNKKSLILIISLLLLIILPNIYGIIRINEFKHSDLLRNNKSIKIGLVQLNVNPWEKWNSSAVTQTLEHKRLTDSLYYAVNGFNLVIWSETAIPFLDYRMNTEHDFSSFQYWIDIPNFALLTGFSDMKIYGPKDTIPETANTFRSNPNIYYDAYNSMLLLNHAPYDNTNPQIYHKVRLTPFSERLPYLELFKFARKYFEWSVGISSWTKGKEQKNLVLYSNKQPIKIAPIICIESTYPGYVRNFVSQGADMLVVITNDAWYDHTFGPEQHVCHAALRAIETRKYLSRCGNSGITGFISPSGEIIQTAPQYQKTAIAGSIPLIKSSSLYDKWGDYLPTICLAVSLFIFILTKFRNFVK